MQGYTHPLVGLLVGSYLFPRRPLYQFGLSLAATAPDLAQLPEFVRIIFTRNLHDVFSPATMQAAEITHSIYLLFYFWLAYCVHCLVLKRSSLFVHTAGLNYLGHIVMDALSHPRSTDISYVWPQKGFKLGMYLGVWDYRWSAMVSLWPPKPFEAFLDVLLLAAITAVQVRQWVSVPIKAQLAFEPEE